MCYPAPPPPHTYYHYGFVKVNKLAIVQYVATGIIKTYNIGTEITEKAKNKSQTTRAPRSLFKLSGYHRD